MKIATALSLVACATALAAPAFAATLSLQKGIKLCEDEIAKLTPPIKGHVDMDETRTSKSQLLIVFNARTSDDRPNKLFCEVDRKTRTTEITAKWPLQLGS
jgi:hypothetical protein